MPGLNVGVALLEALEVRDSPLSEDEVWAILCQTCEALQDIFLKETENDGQDPSFIITPDTLVLSLIGRVHFNDNNSVMYDKGSAYVPPEMLEGMTHGDDAAEKVHVFSLGMTLYNAADYNLPKHQELGFSDTLDSLLCAMCDENPAMRLSLVNVLEACSLHSQKQVNCPPNSHYISSLYKMVLGSSEEMDIIFQETSPDRSGQSKKKPSSKNHSPNSSKSSPGSKSQTSSKGRDKHGASGGSSHHNSYSERPRPDGRDWIDGVSVNGHDSHRGSSKKRKHRSNYNQSGASSSTYDSFRPSNRTHHSSKSKLRNISKREDSTMAGPSYHLSDISFGSSEPSGMASRNNSKMQQFFSNSRNSQHLSKYSSQKPSLNQSRHSTNLHRSVLQKSAVNNNLGKSSQSSRRSKHAPSSLVESTYARLKERRRKLEILRSGLNLEDYENDDAISLSEQSVDTLDVKSLASGPSYTHGTYRPDLYPHYGSTVALHMGTGGRSTPEHDESVISSEAPYRSRKQRLPTQRTAPSTHRQTLHDQNGLGQGDDMLDPALMLSTATDWDPEYLNHMVSSTDPYTQEKTSKKKTKKQKTVENPSRPYTNGSVKRHFGPEFVTKAQEPEVELRVSNLNPSKKAQPRKVTVILLNGQRLLIACNTSSRGNELLEAVITHMSLPEHYYFGISHVKDGEHFFIDRDAKIHKVAPPNWKDPHKGQLPPMFTLFFRVRFYVNRMAVLKHSLTKHLFYLQLRRDILEERTYCHEEQVMSLSSLALQAEYGDYNRDIHGRNYFQPEHYICPRLLRRLGTGYFRDNLPSLHRGHEGCSEVESEMQYLQETQKLEEYGIHFHKVLKNKNDQHSHVWAGLSVRGLYLAEKTGSEREITHCHPWVQTQKISFNRRRFSVLPKSDNDVLKLSKFSYYTESYRKGRYLLQQCTVQHRFQIQMRSRDNVSQMFQQDYPADTMKQEKVEYVPIPEQDYDEEISQNSEEESRHSEDDLDEEVESPYAEVRVTGSQRRIFAPVKGPTLHGRPPIFASDHPALEGQRNPPSLAEHHQQRLASTQRTPGGRSAKAYVVDASIRSQDRSLFPHLSETISDSLNERFENMPVPDSPERQIAMVSVPKDKSGGLGITIVGGENPRVLGMGIFVKTVIPGGPADRTKRVFPGDRIVAINGQSLEGMPQRVAVDLIRNSPREVQLLLSQVKLRTDSISGYEGDFEDPAGLSQLNQSFSSGSNISATEQQPVNSQNNLNDRATRNTPQNRSQAVVEQVSRQEVMNTSQPVMTSGRKTPNHYENVAPPVPTNVNLDEISSSSDQNSDQEVANILPQTSQDFHPYEDIQFSNKKPPSGSQERVKSATPKAEAIYATVNKKTKSAPNGQVATPVVQNGSQQKDIHADQSRQNFTADQDDYSESEVAAVFLSSQAAVQNRGKTLKGKTPSPVPPTDNMRITPQQRPGSNFSAFSDSPLSLGGYDASSSSTPHPGSGGDQPDDLSPGDQYEVLLEKINGSLGLNVTGGVNTSVKHGGIYVKTMVQRGAAHSCGTIRIGDRVLLVNDVSLEGVTHKQAVETLRSAPQVCKLVMERGVPLPPRTGMSPAFKTPPVTPGLSEYDSVSMGRKSERDATDAAETAGEEDSEYPFVNRGNTFAVDLQKGSSGLGFSVYGGVTPTNTDPNKAVVRVRKIFPLGAAASSGKLKVGDVILEVNGKTIKGLTHNETVTILRTAPPVTSLLICRPDSSILSPIPDRGRESPYDRDFSMSPISFGMSPTPLSTVSEKSRTTPTNNVNDKPRETNTPSKLTHEENNKQKRSKTPSLPAENIIKPQVVSEVQQQPQQPAQFGSMGLVDSESESEFSSDSHESAPSVVRSPIQTELLEGGRDHLTPVNQSVQPPPVTPTPIRELDRMLGGMETPRKTPHGHDSFTSQSSMRDTPRTHLHREESLQSSNATPTHRAAVGRDDSVRSSRYSVQSSVPTPSLDNTTYSTMSGVERGDSVRSNLTGLERVNSTNSNVSNSSSQGSYKSPLPDDTHSRSSTDIDESQTQNSPSNLLNVTVTEDQSQITSVSHEDSFVSSVASPLPNDEDERVENEDADAHGGSDSEYSDDEEPLPGEIEVVLTKGPTGGLGFTVGGGTDEIGPFVKAVVADPAKADGRLQPGDQLMMVNDTEMVEMSHADAVKCLRSAPQTVSILVYRDPDMPPPLPTSAPPSERDLATTMELVDKYSTDDQSDASSLDTPPDSEDEQDEQPTVYEQKTPLQESTSDLDESKTDEDMPKQSVKDLIKNFDASSSVIKPQQYGVKKASTRYLTPESALENSSPEPHNRTGSAISHQSKSDVSWGDVSLPLSDDDHDMEVSEKMDKPVHGLAPPQIYSPDSGVTRIDLNKPLNGGLGFSLVAGDRGSTSGIYIKAVTPGSIAAQDGRLRVGDKLLQVNGESLIGMTQSKAVAVLRKTRGTVTLAISRPAGSRPNSNVGAPVRQSDTHDILNKLPIQSPMIPEHGEPISDEDDDDETLQSLIDSVGPSYQRSMEGTMSHDPDDTESDFDSSEFDWPNNTKGASSNKKRKSPNSISSQRSYASSLRSNGSWHSNTSKRSFHSTHSNSSRSSGGGGKIRINPKYANPPALPKTAPPEDSESDLDSWGDDSDIPLPGENGSVKAMRPIHMSSDSDAASMLSEPYSTSLLPHEITIDWLAGLPIVEPVSGGQYSGHAVQSIISQLEAKMEREDPLEEYKLLRQVRLTDNCDDAKLPENKPKNRYRNVLPYDTNRVFLSGSENYINASHIRIPLGKDMYQFIACQGPLQQTSDDFWRMVWEQKVNAIAMVTLDMETGKVKCHRYWPDSVETPLYVCDRFKVSLMKSQRLPNFDIRNIQIEDEESGEKHFVMHLNYTSWPDHGVPSSAQPLLQYIRLMHLVHSSGPIVVHCSAGIGRTGALITIDIALGSIERDLKFDINNIVTELRKQRPGMIQTKDQYLFCYKACIEALQSINK